MINENAKLYTVPALINENYVIRFAVCAQDAVESDIEYANQMLLLLS
jgi:aromatic-L-amino-acid decarboxylase